MTTDSELRDLLATEAGGPSRGAGAWDDVVRRGQHRQRMRRIQGVAVLAVVVGAALTAVALSAGDATVDTGPSATDPAPAVPEDIDPSTILRHEGTQVEAARAQGTSLTLFFGDPDLCRDLRPVVRESAGEIRVGLVAVQDDRAVPWSDCGFGMRRNLDPWGTVDLRTPAVGRSLIDLSTGQAVPVQDSAELLFPTSLPAPFDLEVYDQDSGGLLGGPEDWFFRFTTDGPEYEHVQLDSWADVESNGSGCDGQVVEVRGADGCFYEDVSNLTWDEDGRAISLSMVTSSVEGTVLDELLAIAEGLEPLEG